MSKHVIVGPNGPFNGGGTEVVISHLDDSIRLGDGTSLITSSTVGADVGLDVNVIGGVVSGNFTTSGLSTAIKTTVITVTDVATKIPTTPLAGRNTMSVIVWTPVNPTQLVYFGGSNVTAVNGYPKLHGTDIILDVKDNAAVELYAICASGESADVRVLEVA